MSLVQVYVTAFSDPMFLPLALGSVGVAFVAFQFFAIPYTVIAAIDPPALRKYKVQDTPSPWREWLWPAARQITINYAFVIACVLVLWPLLLRHLPFHFGPLPPWYVIVGQIVFIVLLEDFLYYWMHRIWHKGWLLKHMHRVHHRIPHNCAIYGNYMHPVEFAFSIGLLCVGPAIVSAHVYVLWLWIVIRQFASADAHAGYVFPWNRAKLFLGYEGAAFHDFHHSQFSGNYAGFLPFWDKVFGTYARGFVAWRARWNETGTVNMLPRNARRVASR